MMFQKVCVRSTLFGYVYGVEKRFLSYLYNNINGDFCKDKYIKMPKRARLSTPIRQLFYTFGRRDRLYSEEFFADYNLPAPPDN